MDKEEFDKLVEAGKIAQKVVAYAKEIVEPGMKLIDLANKIDDKIAELGAKPAFPVNLSVNEVAAHATPAYNDEEIARGLLKIDIGVHVDGYVADTAFTLDLEGDEENKKLILAAEEGLKAALEVIDNGVVVSEIGKVVEEKIAGFGFSPIRNLSGHEIKQFDLHAGLTIPNYDSGQKEKIEKGVYAIEPFSTNGAGKVRDGKPSGIYHLVKPGNIRDNLAREVLTFIAEEFATLPFCSRWIHKKFAGRGILALRQIEQAGIIYQYPQLVEAGGGKVAQAEHTVSIVGGNKIITTLP
jgi:methionyl aminopeptidase